MQADIHSPRAYTRHNRPPPAPKTPRSAPVGEIFIPARGSVVIAAWYKSAVGGPRSPPVRILADCILFTPRGGPPMGNPRPHMATGRWKWWRGVIQHQMHTFVKMHPPPPNCATGRGLCEYTLAHRPGGSKPLHAIESATGADHYSGAGLNSPEL